MACVTTYDFITGGELDVVVFRVVDSAVQIVGISTHDSEKSSLIKISVSRRVQLGSFKAFQTEDYLMVVVFVGIYWRRLGRISLTSTRRSSHASSYS